MQEQLISFETAKLAKEKGFRVIVPQGYNSNELEYQRFGLPKGVQFGICTNDLPNSYTAPTQSLLQRWLREVHKINVESNYLPNIQKYSCLYIPMTGKASRKDIEYVSKIRFDTYEEALELGLQEALKLI